MYAQTGKEKKAQDLYEKLSYMPAIEKYERYLKKNPDNYEALWRLSNSYRLTNQYAEAEYWYGQTVQHPECDAEHKLYYAQVLQTNGKYSEAATWYNNYKELVPSDGRASYQGEACGEPSQFYVEEERYKIKNEGFNSKSYDFGAVYYKEGLVYSSSWDLEQAIERIHTWTGTPFFDLYYVEKDEAKEAKEEVSEKTSEDEVEEKVASSATQWKKPKELKGEANTKYHEGPVTFSQDGSRVWFTRNNYDGKVGKSSDGIVKLKLYRADLDGDKWVNVEEFQYNNDEYSVGHAALSTDGSKLYFVSDMPGGYGGTDLYVSEGSGDSWGTPMNLGPAINTEGDEMFPYVHLDGKLYFASDGLGGMGGLDIFEAKGEGTNWGRVKNVGHPVNSSYDDFSLVYNPKHTGGYLTSDRPGGQGSDDIYSFTDDGIYLEGIVVDKETDEPICASEVKLLEGDPPAGGQAEKGTVVTECDGYFEFVVLPNREYSLPATAEGYEPGGEEVSTTDVKPGEKIEVKIPLQPIKPIILVVTVTDKLSGKLLEGAKVGVLGACEDSLMQGESDANGKSMYELERDGCEYAINANMKNYLPGDGNISTPKGYETDTLEITIALEYLDLTGIPFGKEGMGIIFHHIYYDFDKSFIRDEADADLEIVYNFMEENPEALVNIASHTDARASTKYNEGLSERRAKSAMNWLVKKGIDKDRLTATGYGESQPLNGCTDNVKCSEEEHQRNRRTEFRLVKDGEERKSKERSDYIVDPCKKCPF